MYAVIVGGGDVGEVTAKRLVDMGYRVTIIEHDDRVCEHLVITLPKAHVICGEATNPRTLERADIKDADVFIAVTGQDNINLMSAILARHYGVPKVIVRVKDLVYMELARVLGFKNVVNPAETTASKIASIIEGARHIHIDGVEYKQIEVIEKEVETEGHVNDISEFKKKDILPVLVIRRNGDVELAKPEVKVKPGDRVVLLKKRSFPSLFHV